MGAVLTRWSVLLLAALLLAAPPHDAEAQQSSDPKAPLRAMEEAFVSVVEHVMPAVVNVSTPPTKEATSEEPQTEERFREFFGPEFFERFFRGRPPREHARSSGSGVIVDAAGYILTNNHVIENAATIEVRLSDQRKFAAKLVGRDPKTDLAVLKVEAPDPLPVAELGDSDRLKIGQWAIAIGNPFGLDRTVTLGIVIQDLSDELASGFGVVPRSGVLVADVMKDSPAEAAGLRAGDIVVEFGGRATPEVPELQRRVAATPPGQPIPLRILRDKKQDRLTVKLGEMPGEETLVAAAPARDGWGLRVAALTAELAQRYDLTAREGVVVMDVAPGSPGERAGIRPGDAILEVDRRPVKSVEAFQQALAQVKPGEGVPVYLQRGGGRNEYIVLKGPEPK